MGVAIIYFVALWIRQLFSGPGRDHHHPTRLKPPPRALSGNGAWPVYGHTPLFRRKGGNIALMFPPDWPELSFFPSSWTRSLGECFALFIWGQWRVVIKGQENASKLLEGQELQDGWIWSPPVLLLGKSCPAILQQEDPEQARQLKSLLHRPLGQHFVVGFASAFAACAGECLSQYQEMSPSNCSADADEESQEAGHGDAMHVCFKLKWEALRTYTLNIIDGPLFNLKLWDQSIEHSEVQGNEKEETYETDKRVRKKDMPPTRERMLLLMERMKSGLDVIKSTFGPEWMYIWIMNEYGRAVNARMHVERLISKHVEKVEATVPVSHKRGHAYYDPSTRTIPLLALKENLARSRESIFGDAVKKRTSIEDTQALRPRSNSLPSAHFLMRGEHDTTEDRARDSVLDDPLSGAQRSSDYMMPFETEQDLARPKYDSPMRSPELAKKVGAHASALLKLQPPPQAMESPSLRQGRKELATKKHVTIIDPHEENKEDKTLHASPKRNRPKLQTPQKEKQDSKPKVMSLLERILRQQGPNKEGISQTVMTEICILLWMMMDVGNAWTAMALHLLSTDKGACHTVQDEIDNVEEEFGNNIFSEAALRKMKYVDALIFEAIRLSPPFLGGLKQTTETVELLDAGVHVAKGSNVFFCQPSEENFDIDKALGKHPESLGKTYPSVEL